MRRNTQDTKALEIMDEGDLNNTFESVDSDRSEDDPNFKSTDDIFGVDTEAEEQKEFQ